MNAQSARLLAEKLTRELFRIAQAYGKEHPYRFEDLTHDFGVMLEHDGLHSLSLKFHRPNAQREVLVEYNYALHAGRPQFHIDDAQGLSIVPLAPPFEMGLIVNRDARGGAYEDRLRLNWSSAPHYARYGGFEHRDGNTTRRTGGRASKEIYMDHTLRQRGNIKFYLPDKQYGFIAGETGAQPGSDIFFHTKNVQGFEPCRGQRVSFLPMVTPRGVQAKDIRLA
ncbi:MAG: cold shock domain-containing protein [Anaerolineae bacterium]|nr:cold shock domain-containing protein [Anaerolineae bacterium]